MMQTNQRPSSGQQLTLLRVAAALLVLGGVVTLASGIALDQWLSLLAGALMVVGGLVMLLAVRGGGNRNPR